MAEQEAEINLTPVGEQLKACRDEKQIGINEIAAQMHLDTRIIRALEEDNYDALPDPIYVRGYIRSYCKLLGLNADKYLDLFRKNAGREDPDIIPEIKYPSQTSSSDKPVKVITYLISLGLVLLVIAWWQSNFIIKNQSFIQPSQPPDAVLVTPEPVIEEFSINELSLIPSIPMEIPGDISIEPADVDMDPDMSAEFATEALSAVVPDINEDELTQNSVPPVSEQANLVTTPDNQLPEEARAVVTNDENIPDQVESLPASGPDTLILKINSDSWIEIFDVNRQKIYFDLGRTGDILTLKGTAPFDILLGFAQGVSIEFNGEAVDQAPYTRAGVARFNLGE